MVQYKQGEDHGLDMHTDDSDVTFNVCLGRNFTGATLTVCGAHLTACPTKPLTIWIPQLHSDSHRLEDDYCHARVM